MRIVHMADLHLSHARFQRIGATGINQREIDVSQTFTRVVTRTIELRPNVIVVAGDIFDSPRPTNSAIVHAFQQWARVVGALPETKIIFVLGNHDHSRQGTAGNVLPLFTSLGIRVVDRAAERISYPDLDLFVLALPDVPGVERPAFTPDPTAKYSLAVIHGEVEGMPRRGGRPRDSRTGEISTASLDVPGWSYLALGHYHIHQLLAPNMAYSGSIDFTSTDVWSELSHPKGFVLRDLETGTHEFIEVTPGRRHVDLPPIDAHGMGAEQLDTAIRDAAATAGDLTGCVVRLIVEGVDRELGRALDQKNLKAVRRGTLNMQIELRRPEREAREPVARTYAELRQRSLSDILDERLARRDVPADVDRAALATLARKYFDDATELQADKRASEPDLLPAAAAKVA